MSIKKQAGRKPAWPKIRGRRNGSGTTSWRVDAGAFGGSKRLVKQFPTLADAEAYAAELRAQRAATHEARRFERRNRAVSLANLNDRQRADVLEAYRLLEGGKRGSLVSAVYFYMKHAAPAGEHTVAEVTRELLTSVEAANRRPRTVRELRERLAAFGGEHGEAGIHAITAHDVEAWIGHHCKGMMPLTRLHYRRCLHRLFAFAVKRGYRETNPVAAIEKPIIDHARPQAHTPAEVRRILDAARKVNPRMIPYLAIGYFAGLRTENELARLNWRDIDLKEKLIRVDPATAKKRRERFVEIRPCLAAWLAGHKRDEGKLFYSRRYFRRIREAAKVDWPSNVMRHTYASNHLAAFNDAGKTALQLGHSGNASVLFNHYRALLRPKDADAFWNIHPDRKGKVIKLAAAG
jgi:integrase/recombinase XerD